MPALRRPSARAVAALAAVLCLAALPALATPSLGALSQRARSNPVDALGRVFPEPMLALDYVQFSPDPVTGVSQYLDGIAELERRYPEVISVDDIGDLIGEPGVRSRGGRQIPVITVTDHAVDDGDKVDLYVSMSIHGLERAGLEGGLRFIEDIAMGYAREQAGGEPYLLSNGNPDKPFFTEMTATEVLAQARLVFVNLNPDGWAAGDRFTPGTGFKRGNDANNLDLNRQWPTIGWSRGSGAQYRTMSEPEAQAGRKLIEEYLGVPEGAADLHGQFNDDVLLAIMFPAGQFDPLGLTQQFELADAIKYNVNNSVFPGAGGLLADLNMPVKPAEFHTAYDAIGYDDSGFQGDYLVQQGILEMDHEYIFSNLVPNNVWVAPLTQVHVDTTRELLKATIVTTIVARKHGAITYSADLGGTVAYVHNPEVLTEAGAEQEPPFGFEQQPYTSTSMRYYADLSRYTATPLVPITADAVAAGAGLEAFDTIVVTDRDLPRYRTSTGVLATPDGAAFWGNLRAFAEGGGNLVLTDAALQGLESMGVVATGSVRRITQYAGSITSVDRGHQLLDGVEGVIGQTYFEVPLGYPVSGGNQAPAWTVATSAWESAGGTRAASAGGQTALGTLDLGQGRIAVFGAVLPDATQRFPHTQGLADYAVTYAGNAIMVNALTWVR
jgi:hypothetical protein